MAHLTLILKFRILVGPYLSGPFLNPLGKVDILNDYHQFFFAYRHEEEAFGEISFDIRLSW